MISKQREASMSSAAHQTCYGSMFPTVLQPAADRVISGRVFSYELRYAGGAFVAQRRLAVNIEAWDECRVCPEFDHCYQLSMGKVSLEAAIRG
jgi:hypothetical protein